MGTSTSISSPRGHKSPRGSEAGYSTLRSNERKATSTSISSPRQAPRSPRGSYRSPRGSEIQKSPRSSAEIRGGYRVARLGDGMQDGGLRRSRAGSSASNISDISRGSLVSDCGDEYGRRGRSPSALVGRKKTSVSPGPDEVRRRRGLTGTNELRSNERTATSDVLFMESRLMDESDGDLIAIAKKVHTTVIIEGFMRQEFKIDFVDPDQPNTWVISVKPFSLGSSSSSGSESEEEKEQEPTILIPVRKVTGVQLKQKGNVEFVIKYKAEGAGFTDQVFRAETPLAAKQMVDHLHTFIRAYRANPDENKLTPGPMLMRAISTPG